MTTSDKFDLFTAGRVAGLQTAAETLERLGSNHLQSDRTVTDLAAAELHLLLTNAEDRLRMDRPAMSDD